MNVNLVKTLGWWLMVTEVNWSIMPINGYILYTSHTTGFTSYIIMKPFMRRKIDKSSQQLVVGEDLDSCIENLPPPE